MALRVVLLLSLSSLWAATGGGKGVDCALRSTTPSSETNTGGTTRRERSDRSQHGPDEHARGLFLMIPDGTGPAVMSLARAYQDTRGTTTSTGEARLHLDDLLLGSVRTSSSDNWITDSAASATAYATGKKTYNGALGVDAEDRPMATILEGAKAKGMFTGLIVTSRVTHATPAAFASHVINREMEQDIARQYVYDQEVDIVLGGGKKYFNEEMLMTLRQKGYAILTNKKELEAYCKKSESSGELKAFGLFHDSHLSYEIDRQEDNDEPSLAEMVSSILTVLKKNDAAKKNGFLIMIEGSRVDHAGHDNDAATLAMEALMYDKTVGIVQQFVKLNSNYAMVSVADHETGGLSIGSKNQTAFADQYTCASGGVCNEYSTRYPYLIQPKALRQQRASAERIRKMIEDSTRSCVQQSSVVMPGCESSMVELTIRLMQEFSSVKNLAPLEKQELDLIASKVVRSGESSYYQYNLLHFLAHSFSDRGNIGWTTGAHTGVDVGLYCFGNDAVERMCRGVHENTRIAEIAKHYLNLDNLQNVTLMLRGQ